ncbi:CCA tRNA nucleotidyltransferase, mitochondrial [Microbotryomycetes sp. JL201]|nr:CCA tRNA nucleotidyltransferase, mitochondrial [Microbotryomycetes sp. JL201]
MTAPVASSSMSGGSGIAPVIHLNDSERQLADLLVECADWVDANPHEVDALRLRDEQGKWVGKQRGNEHVELRIAGGWVRDKLLGRSSDDIDISTAPDPITGAKFAALFEKHLELRGQRHLMGKLTKIDAKPDQSKHLETATAIVCGLSVDWVQQRGQEQYSEDSRIPTVVGRTRNEHERWTRTDLFRVVQAFGTPLEDAERRDLTINALFYNLRTRSIEDQTGKGLADLGLVPGAQKQIRTPLEPFKTFHDDPLRVIRAVRFAARFGREYLLNDELVKAIGSEEIRAALRDPKKISRERVGIELEKMLASTRSDPLYAMELVAQLHLHDLVFLYDPQEVNSFSNPGHPEVPNLSLSYAAAKVLHSLLSADPSFPPLHRVLHLERVVPAADATPSPFPSETEIYRIYPVTIKRLYLSCGLLPLYDLSAPDKKKVVWVGEKIVRDGIKWPTHDFIWAKKAREASMLLSEGVRRHARADATDSAASRVDIGLLLRNASVHDMLHSRWNVSVLWSLIVDIVKNPVSASELIQSYNAFVAKVLALGLDVGAFEPPLLDGKQVNDLFPDSRGSPAMTSIMALVIEFQLRNPLSTAEDCKTYLLANTDKVDALLSRFPKKVAQPKKKKVAFEDDPATQRFVIGKIDGKSSRRCATGIAVLISDSVHLIEFPSLLLPSGVGPGSIVNITCTRNTVAEKDTNKAFWDLQNDIFTEFGAEEPQAPKLRIRNTTQTSVTLEWDKLELAKAKLLGLSIWRNGQRLTSIPNPLHNTSTKLSGLSLDTDYTFHLVMKTTAGTLSSPIVKTRTHTINDTSGLSVCFGHVEPEKLLDEAQTAIRDMKAKYSDKIQIDTTHFVATSPASPSNPSGGPGPEYQKALQLSIPVVSPEWVLACHREQKMVPISNYYIGAVNHAASLSSAQLVTSTGQIPPSKPVARRATAASIPEEGAGPAENAPSATATVRPAVPPAPTSLSRTELAEEEPERPPADSAVAGPAQSETAEDIETRPPAKAESPTITITAPEETQSTRVDAPTGASEPAREEDEIENEQVNDLNEATEAVSLADDRDESVLVETSSTDAVSSAAAAAAAPAPAGDDDTATVAGPGAQDENKVEDDDEMEEVGLQ